MNRTLILLLVLLILAGAVRFLAGRFAFYLGLSSLRLPIVLFGLLLLFVISGVIPLSNHLSRWAHGVYCTASVLMGVLWYLFLSALVVELFRWGFSLSPRAALTMTLLLTSVVLGWGFLAGNLLRTSRITCRMPGLAREVRIMHASDLHLGHFRGKSFLEKILRRAAAEKVEALFITGDLFDGRWQLREEVFRTLERSPVPVVFVEGNHERYTGASEIKKRLREAGVKVLENEVMEWNGIQVVGLNYLRAGKGTKDLHARSQGPTMKEVLARLPLDPSRPSILLHHAPVAPDLAVQHGIDLYLAGHTHGGQFFPFTLVAAAAHPYNKGVHDHRGMCVYVSQGAGTFGPPLRVGTRSEVAVITLVPGENNDREPHKKTRS